VLEYRSDRVPGAYRDELHNLNTTGNDTNNSAYNQFAQGQLTDGIDGVYNAWGPWVGWDAVPSVNIDLRESTGDPLVFSSVFVQFARGLGGITVPSQIQAFVSNDGITWTLVGSTVPVLATNGAAWAEIVVGAQSVNFVRLKVTTGGPFWTFLGEIRFTPVIVTPMACATFSLDGAQIAQRELSRPLPANLWVKVGGTSKLVQNAQIQYDNLLIRDTASTSTYLNETFDSTTGWSFLKGAIGACGFSGGTGYITSDWCYMHRTPTALPTAGGLHLTLDSYWGAQSNGNIIALSPDPATMTTWSDNYLFADINLGLYGSENLPPTANVAHFDLSSVSRFALLLTPSVGWHTLDVALVSGACP